MHEMGLAQEIVRIAQASIPPQMQAAQVRKINLRVGRLSAVIPESLRFCFEVVAKDTAVQDAVLQIEEIEVTARCEDCNNAWTLEAPVFSCPACHSGRVQMISGRELEIASIEIED